MQSILVRLLLVMFLLGCLRGYQETNTFEQVVRFNEVNTQYPILHLYHNHKLSSTPKFQQFLEVFKTAESRNRDYSRFIVTDCQAIQPGDMTSCDEMISRDLIWLLYGYSPSSGSFKYGNKRMKSPFQIHTINYSPGELTVEDLESYLNALMPNYYEKLYQQLDYDQYLKPKYVPKLLFVSRQDDVPLVLRKLAVRYFLQFDFAHISDLQTNLVYHLKLKQVPAVVVLKYNFTSKLTNSHQLTDIDFSPQSYSTLKQILALLALQQPRNDLYFHTIRIEPDRGIMTARTDADLEEMLERSFGMVIVSKGNGEPVKLRRLRERYGRFISYIHMPTDNKTEQLYFYRHEQGLNPLLNEKIHFMPIEKGEFLERLNWWMRKDFVMLSVRERYAHFCGLDYMPLFRGVTQCNIIKERDYSSFSKEALKFDQGFASFETKFQTQTKGRIRGNELKGSFENIYKVLENLIMMKTQEILQDFQNNRIKPLDRVDTLWSYCAFPYKKCALLFMHSQKEWGPYEYLKDSLKEIAINYIPDYQILQIDLACNPHFADQVEQLRKIKAGLLVYHSRYRNYSVFKDKLSKQNIRKFLEVNLKDKNIKLKYFKHSDIKINPCQTKKEQNDL